jgi:hypothetical protein
MRGGRGRVHRRRGGNNSMRGCCCHGYWLTNFIQGFILFYSPKRRTKESRVFNNIVYWCLFQWTRVFRCTLYVFCSNCAWTTGGCICRISLDLRLIDSITRVLNHWRWRLLGRTWCRIWITSQEEGRGHRHPPSVLSRDSFFVICSLREDEMMCRNNLSLNVVLLLGNILSPFPFD